MFTKIFNKTSFWSYLVVLFIFYGAVFNHYNVVLINSDENTASLTVILVLSTISLLLVEWTVRRQLFFEKSSYHLLFFALFFWLLPIKQWDVWIWISILLFWISFSQVLKLNIKEINKKNLFNAGFWLFFAALFKVDFLYFYLFLWGILYIRGQLNFRNIFLTILPIACFLIVWYALYVSIPNFPSIGTISFTTLEAPFLWDENYSINIKLIFILLSSVIIVVGILRKMGLKNQLYKTTISCILLMLVASIIMLFFSGSENFIAWASLLICLAIFSAKFFKRLPKSFVEIFFILCFGVILQDKIRLLLFGINL